MSFIRKLVLGLLITQLSFAGSLHIVVDSLQWLPPNMQDSLRLKLDNYIKNFPVDILVAVLSDTSKEDAIRRVKNLAENRDYMTIIVLPKKKDALIIPHPAIKDTYKLQQVQEQMLKPIVFAGGYYYAIYSTLLLLGQTPPAVDENVLSARKVHTEQQDTMITDSSTDSVALHEKPTKDFFSPRNVSRAIAIIVALLVAYLSWRRWREYKRQKSISTTE